MRAGGWCMTNVFRIFAMLLLAVASAPADAQRGAEDRIASDVAFDKLARTESAGRFFELPRVMFAIDRNGAQPRVHWIDTRRYLYHFDYLQARYLTLADAD